MPTDIDLTSEPLGTDNDGQPVYLKDIWPTQAEISEVVGTCVTADQFERQYGNVFEKARAGSNLKQLKRSISDYSQAQYEQFKAPNKALSLELSNANEIIGDAEKQLGEAKEADAADEAHGSDVRASRERDHGPGRQRSERKIGQGAVGRGRIVAQAVGVGATAILERREVQQAVADLVSIALQGGAKGLDRRQNGCGRGFGRVFARTTATAEQ